MKFEAIIFDMDGVLIDTESYYAQYRADFFSQQQIDISHLTNRDFIGGNMKDLWPKILRESYTPKKAAQLQTDYIAYKSLDPIPYETLLFPDVPLVLETLKKENYKIALASSSAMKEINQVLDIHHLRSYFDELLSGNDFKVSKPNPAIYLAAMQKLGVQATDSLIIEDSQNGILAGKSAGATVWAIEDTCFGMDQEKADCLIPNLTAILSKMKQGLI